MARTGVLPRRLDHVNGKSAPAFGAIATSMVSLVVIVLFVVAGLDLVVNMFVWFSSLAVLSIVLREILVVGEEARNPRRNLPLAQISALVTAVILYMLTGYGLVSAANPGALGDSAAPLSLAMETVIPGAAAALIAVAALTATGTSTVGCLLGSSRMLFAAGREKAAPSVFGRVSPKTRVPAAAILMTGVVALGTTLMALGDFVTAITTAVGAAVFANWFMMVLMNVAVIVTRVQRPDLKPAFRYPFNIRNIPVLAIVAAVAALWVITYIDTVPLLLGISWLVLLTIYYFAYSRSRWQYLSEDDMDRLATQDATAGG